MSNSTYIPGSSSADYKALPNSNFVGPVMPASFKPDFVGPPAPVTVRWTPPPVAFSPSFSQSVSIPSKSNTPPIKISQAKWESNLTKGSNWAESLMASPPVFTTKVFSPNKSSDKKSSLSLYNFYSGNSFYESHISPELPKVASSILTSARLNEQATRPVKSEDLKVSRFEVPLSYLSGFVEGAQRGISDMRAGFGRAGAAVASTYQAVQEYNQANESDVSDPFYTARAARYAGSAIPAAVAGSMYALGFPPEAVMPAEGIARTIVNAPGRAVGEITGTEPFVLAPGRTVGAGEFTPGELQNISELQKIAASQGRSYVQYRDYDELADYAVNRGYGLGGAVTQAAISKGPFGALPGVAQSEVGGLVSSLGRFNFVPNPEGGFSAVDVTDYGSSNPSLEYASWIFPTERTPSAFLSRVKIPVR